MQNTMDNFTYEIEDCATELEKFEWDNTWIDHANDLFRRRVLYIGDSISCVTRRAATAETEKEVLFDGYGSSKSIDNPFFYEGIKLFARQQKQRCAVLFNNGLHGWHLSDDTQYKCYYEKMIRFLIKEFDKTPVILALTTHVMDKDREKRVIVRNQVVKELASQYGLGVIDLYQVSLDAQEFYSKDGVHLVQEGYDVLAKEIVRFLKAENVF